MRYPDVRRMAAGQHGRPAIWFPIENFSAPSARSVMPILRMIVERLEAGEGVVMHCAAGQGRAGTMAACVLMALGIDRRRRANGGVAPRLRRPRQPAQWALVEGVAALLARRRSGPVHGR